MSIVDSIATFNDSEKRNIKLWPIQIHSTNDYFIYNNKFENVSALSGIGTVYYDLRAAVVEFLRKKKNDGSYREPDLSTY